MPDGNNQPFIGEVIGNNYEITAIAGSGGMGVVYRALDLRLQRSVALKFLPPDLNSSVRNRDRFLREARTASSLDHPNIGVIHGIEETSDGRTFIVMAYYDGPSLATRILHGALSLHESLDIAIQIATGLAEAHARYVVHRDVKPSNVMLTGSGAVRIVDFGVAHMVTAKTMSETGASGTISYMSPEQAMNRQLDQRTDIWALGVVLAEMLTGHNPFQRETLTATLLAILNEPPTGLDHLPLDIQRIVYRALSKDPDTRYADCSELVTDLELAREALPDEPAVEPHSASRPAFSLGSRAGAPPISRSGMKSLTVRPHSSSSKRNLSAELRTFVANASTSALAVPPPPRRRGLIWLAATLATALLAAALLLIPAVRQRLLSTSLGSRIAALFTAPERHIAVLPFDNIGGNPENEALIAGLMDSLSGKLSNLNLGTQTLWVIPTSEVRRLNVADPASALKQLGATLVVKGSVQRDGQQVRLNVNLIDTKDLRQLGSADLEDAAGDLSTLQNEAVSRLARLMNLSISADMLRSTGGSVNPAAYEDYLTALGNMQRYDKPGNLDSAITALKNSIRTDPRFALGYAQLGEAYRLKYQLNHGFNWLDEALAYCQRAVDLDNSMPAVYVTLGRIHDATGKHDLALQEFQHALDLDPKNADALGGLATAYEGSGRIADAEAAHKKAIAFRPESWDGYNALGLFYDGQARYPEAISAFQRALALTPDNSQVYFNLAAAYIDSGDIKSLPAAEQALKRSLAIRPSYEAYANLGNIYALQKRYADSAAAIEQALQLNQDDYLVWNNLMVAYEWLGNTAKADSARGRMQPLVEHAVTVKPRDASARSMLAILYAKDKLNDKALTDIQSALALDPDDPDVLANAADVYEITGDRRHALEYLDRGLKKGLALDQVRNDPDMQSLLRDPAFHSSNP